MLSFIRKTFRSPCPAPSSRKHPPVQMTPSSFFRQTQAVWTAVVIGSLAACTNIKNDSDRTRTEGALTGAAAGAALGAGAGALLKKTPGGAVAGAAAGALIGGAAGAAYGNSVAKKKEGYAVQESALDAQLSGLKHRRLPCGRTTRKAARPGRRQAGATGHGARLRPLRGADRAGVRPAHLHLYEDWRRSTWESKSWQETTDAHKAVLTKSDWTTRIKPTLQKAIDELTEQRAELLRQRANLTAINDKLKNEARSARRRSDRALADARRVRDHRRPAPGRPFSAGAKARHRTGSRKGRSVSPEAKPNSPVKTPAPTVWRRPAMEPIVKWLPPDSTTQRAEQDLRAEQARSHRENGTTGNRKPDSRHRQPRAGLSAHGQYSRGPDGSTHRATPPASPDPGSRNRQGAGASQAIEQFK